MAEKLTRLKRLTVSDFEDIIYTPVEWDREGGEGGEGGTGTREKRGWMGRVWEVGKERVESGIPNVEGSGKQIRKTYTTLDININFAIKKAKRLAPTEKEWELGLKGSRSGKFGSPARPHHTPFKSLKSTLVT